jgi:hypothetical protein
MKSLVQVICVFAAVFAAAADGATNDVTFTNRFGRVFANVRIEKADGESISWVSSTNAFIFGRCPVSQLTRETYQKLGVTDSEVSDAALAKAKAQHQVPTASTIPKRKIITLSSRIVLGMTASEVESMLGAPDKKNRSVYASGTQEQWVYGSSYVYLQQDKVTSWQESE